MTNNKKPSAISATAPAPTKTKTQSLGKEMLLKISPKEMVTF